MQIKVRPAYNTYFVRMYQIHAIRCTSRDRKNFMFSTRCYFNRYVKITGGWKAISYLTALVGMVVVARGGWGKGRVPAHLLYY